MTSELTGHSEAKEKALMEDQDCYLMQGMIPLYEKMKTVTGR